MLLRGRLVRRFLVRVAGGVPVVAGVTWLPDISTILAQGSLSSWRVVDGLGHGRGAVGPRRDHFAASVPIISSVLDPAFWGRWVDPSAQAATLATCRQITPT